MAKVSVVTLVVIILQFFAGGLACADEGFVIQGKSGSLRLGVLAQPAFQAAGLAHSSAVSQDFFLRRLRLMAGMTLGDSFEVFFQTDSPKLGLFDAAVKVLPSAVVLQDAFTTYKAADYLKVDAGLMPVPFIHNALQGAGMFHSLDYFSNTFGQSVPLQNFNGRDTGVEARGLVAQTVEYRVGVFQGKRTGLGQNSPRFLGRVQVNFLEPETLFFYAGTYGGAKRIFSVGAAFDTQAGYKGFGGDAFLDLPLGEGVLTAQLDIVHLDGGSFLGTLPQNWAYMGEAGYRIKSWRLSPIVRAERRSVDAPSVAFNSQTELALGAAYWIDGHTTNVKLFFTRVTPDTLVDPAATSFGRVNLQFQLFYF